ncbi:MAG: hypothetical protein M0Z41_00980 [Peptococcaceae bacterium]|nr:hypothetical protein [Peptococcaceae bacterium]
MYYDAALKILGILGALFLLEAYALLVARQMRGIINLYAGHSALLAALAATVGYLTGSWYLYLVAALTVLFKVLAIPYTLKRVIHDTVLEKREIHFVFGMSGSLLIGGLLSLLAYFTSTALVFPGDTLARLLLPVGSAVALVGLFITVGRLEAVPQISGLLVMENGIILIAVVTAFGVPLIVEFGLFFDVLVGALLLGVLVMRLFAHTETTAAGSLRRLKG